MMFSYALWCFFYTILSDTLLCSLILSYILRCFYLLSYLITSYVYAMLCYIMLFYLILSYLTFCFHLLSCLFFSCVSFPFRVSCCFCSHGFVHSFSLYCALSWVFFRFGLFCVYTSLLYSVMPWYFRYDFLLFPVITGISWCASVTVCSCHCDSSFCFVCFSLCSCLLSLSFSCSCEFFLSIVPYSGSTPALTPQISVFGDAPDSGQPSVSYHWTWPEVQC